MKGRLENARASKNPFPSKQASASRVARIDACAILAERRVPASWTLAGKSSSDQLCQMLKDRVGLPRRNLPPQANQRGLGEIGERCQCRVERHRGILALADDNGAQIEPMAQNHVLRGKDMARRPEITASDED